MKHFKSLTLAALLALFAGDSFADSGSKTTPCYMVGKTINVDNGCTLNVKSGGTLTYSSGSTENTAAVATTIPAEPGVRLTLSSTAPVMTTDSAAATTVYALPYKSQIVPVYNGTGWNKADVGSTGISFALGSTNMPSAQVYDVYLTLVSGTPTLCSMYWGSNTSRSSSAGGKSGAADARIQQLNGIWVNKTAITASDCFGGASGTTGVAIAQNQGTLLGSYYTTGSGQTGWVCKPSAASGGASVVMGIDNAYNRLPVSCSNRDSATSVTSASASWATLGSGDNSIILDALGQESFSVDAHIVAGNSTISDFGNFGVACAGTGTTAPTVIASTAAPTSTVADNYATLAVHEGFYPSLGLSTCYAEKMSSAATTTYMPVTSQEDFTINAIY